MAKTIRVTRYSWEKLQEIKIHNDFTTLGETIAVLLDIATPERIKEWWDVNEPKMRKEFEEMEKDAKR